MTDIMDWAPGSYVSMRERVELMVSNYANLAVMRSNREVPNPEFTVEDALEWCIFYLWALENLEGTEECDAEG